MNLPSIDLASLPDLNQLTGVFGSLSNLAGPTTDDRIVVLMVYVYEMVPPNSFL